MISYYRHRYAFSYTLCLEVVDPLQSWTYHRINLVFAGEPSK
jgi:hypothetical protein